MSGKNGHRHLFKQDNDNRDNTTKKCAKPEVATMSEDDSKNTGSKPQSANTGSAATAYCLLPKDEIKILKHWGLLKKTVVIGHIIDPLIEKGVYTPDQWMALKTMEVSENEKVEEFLYHILKSKPETYDNFLLALKSRGYGHVVNQLEGLSSANVSPSVSASRSGSSSKSMIGRPATIGKIFPKQHQTMSMSDPRNGINGYMDHGASSGDNCVTQDDLVRMKEDITDELRQLRMNIEKDRDQDRLELQLVQRKHTELQDDLAKATSEREHLMRELSVVTENVKRLTSQMEVKEIEYKEIREKNKDLENQLENKTSDLQKLINQKEREKAELSRTLQAKETDYKKLQGMLEKLKDEHEERLARLKSINKEKIKLEKELQLLNKEKRNLEVKIKSLEQHIHILQERHYRETSDIKIQLEKQKTLLDEKEKERYDLERKLEESVRENENLKQKNYRLSESLQKTQDEKLHLQQKVKQSEFANYAVPPFLVGKSTRPNGWKPNRSSYK